MTDKNDKRWILVGSESAHRGSGAINIFNTKKDLLIWSYYNILISGESEGVSCADFGLEDLENVEDIKDVWSDKLANEIEFALIDEYYSIESM